VTVGEGRHEVLLRQPHCLAALDRSGQLWLVTDDAGLLTITRVADGKCETTNEFEYEQTSDCPFALLPDARKLYLLRRRGVLRQLVEADLESGSLHTITGAQEVAAAAYNSCSLLAVPPQGPLWFPLSTPSRPAEVYVCAPDSRKRQVSDLNSLAEGVAVPEVRKVTWESARWQIEGLLVMPMTREAQGPCPTLVYLHGGPERAVEYAFEVLASPRSESAAYYFAVRGFAVFLPNFRGSSGYGREFQAQIGDYHLFDRPFQDVMCGVRALIDRGIADPEAMGIYGQSYGADLTVWTIAHSDAFRGAVAAAGTYDYEFVGRYSNQLFHTLVDTRRGTAEPEEVWRHPELFRHLSPMAHASTIHTPMLLVETFAERRGFSRARPLFNTLRALSVETSMAYYPNAFHGGGWNDGYKRDFMRRTLAWFRHCLVAEDLPDWFSASSRECT